MSFPSQAFWTINMWYCLFASIDSIPFTHLLHKWKLQIYIKDTSIYITRYINRIQYYWLIHFIFTNIYQTNPLITRNTFWTIWYNILFLCLACFIVFAFKPPPIIPPFIANSYNSPMPSLILIWKLKSRLPKKGEINKS